MSKENPVYIIFWNYALCKIPKFLAICIYSKIKI